MVEGVADKLDVGIDDGRSQRLGTVEAFTFHRVAKGVRVDAQLTGDGADFPVFGVKIAADLRADFRTDHAMGHLRRGMRGKGSMKRPARPQIRQRSTRRAGSAARTAAPEDALLNRPVHNRMMPGKRSKGNLDPSRAIAFDASGIGTHAGDRDDRVALRGSVGGVGWRAAAAGGGLVDGIGRCSSGVRGRSACR